MKEGREEGRKERVEGTGRGSRGKREGGKGGIQREEGKKNRERKGRRAGK